MSAVSFTPALQEAAIVDQPPSPPVRRLRQPSWLDLRLVVGVLLVLVSVVAGARVVASADRSVQVWAVAHDAAAGTTLTSADIKPARVRLFESASHYLLTSQQLAGRTLSRDVHAGELLPRSAVGQPATGALVSIPLQPQNAPAVARGDAVDVWSSAKGCPPVRLLAAAPVHEVRATGGGALSVSSGGLSVIVRIPTDQVRQVVAALGAEATVRLVVLDGVIGDHAAPPESSSRCSLTPRSQAAGSGAGGG
jgi:SAF domain